MIRYILFYRYLHDLRTISTRNPLLIKNFILGLLFLLMIPLLISMFFQFFLAFQSQYINAVRLDSIPLPLQLATLLLSILQMTAFLTEFSRSFTTCSELKLFELANVPPLTTISYLVLRSSIRSLPTILFLSSFTPLLLWKLERPLGIVLLSITLEIPFIMAIIGFVLVIFIHLMEYSSRWGLSEKSLAVILNVPMIIISICVFSFFTPGFCTHLNIHLPSEHLISVLWSNLSISSSLIENTASGITRSVCLAIIYVVLSLGVACLFINRRWKITAWDYNIYRAECVQSDARTKGRIWSSESMHFSVIEKDFKQIQRDQASRAALSCVALFVAIMVIVRSIAVFNESFQISMVGPIRMTLSFLLIPLALSTRAMVQEIDNWDIYRLSISDPWILIMIKVRFHSLINLLCGFLLALVSFLLTNHPLPIEIVLILPAVVVIFSPLMTSLAIAIGILFPDRTGVRSLFGVQIKGIIIYGFVYLFTYAITSFVFELLISGKTTQALSYFSIGLGLAMSGPVALVVARHRLLHSYR